MYRKTFGIVLLFLSAVLVPAAADDPQPATAALSAEERELAEMERLRVGIEDVFDSYRDVDPEFQADSEPLWRHVDRLLAFGADAVPLWEQELDGGDMRNYYLAVFAAGFLDSDRAVPLLRRTLERIPAGGTYNRTQRRLACFNRALQGDAEVLAFMLEGTAELAIDPMFSGWATLVAAGAVLDDAGRTKLIELARKFDTEDTDDHHRLSLIMSALTKVPGPETTAAAKEFLDNPLPFVRYGAVRAIGAERGPTTAGRMLEFLRTRTDEDRRIRAAAAEALADVATTADLEAVLTQLEIEKDTYVRGRLYRTIALVAGERGLPALRSHWGSSVRDDRVRLIDAVGLIHSNEALNLVRRALADPDTLVALHAIEAFRNIATPAAVDSLLAAIRDPRKTVSSSAIRALLAVEERRAAPRVASVLLHDELAARDELTTVRDRVRLMGNAVVVLEYVEPRSEIRALATRQSDVEVREALNSTADRLDRIASRGTDVAAWLPDLDAPDEEDRRLAYRQIARIGNEKAIDALTAAFDAADTEAREALLTETTRSGNGAFLPLYERILDDPALDFDRFHELRAWAAWGASRIGTDRAIEALKRNAVRRDGRDFHVVAYLLGLDVPEVATFVDGFRLPRLRRPTFERGAEQDELDSMVGAKRLGRDDTRWHMAPDQLLAH